MHWRPPKKRERGKERERERERAKERGRGIEGERERQRGGRQRAGGERETVQRYATSQEKVVGWVVRSVIRSDVMCASKS